MKLSDLITRHLLGIATGEEERRLQDWLDASAEHRAQYARLVERLHTDLLAEEPADVRREWARFEGRLPLHERRMLGVRRLIKYAAAAVVVLAVLAGGLWYLLPDAGDGRVAAIVPGSPKAMLETGSGEGVEIFPDASAVEQQTDTWAVRNEKGVLRYDLPTRADSLRSLFHTLTVPRGGEYAVVLADGTKINVNSESRLRYPVVFAPSDSVRRVYVSGEAYFQVARNEEMPFEVHTGHGVVRVLGTKFNVHDYADEGYTAVTLTEGAVVYVSGGQTYLLKPGDQLVHDHVSGRIGEQPVDALAYCSWIDGVFEFTGMPLDRIMRQLSRWYDFSYRFEDPALEKRLFTGIAFRNVPLQTLLRQIEKTTRIHFMIEDRTIIITN